MTHDRCVRHGLPAIDPIDAIASMPRPQPKRLERVRTAIRARHYSHRTEEAYAGWIRRFILFHNKRHPAAMGKLEFARLGV